MLDTHNKLQYGNNCNDWKILDLVLDLNYISFSYPNPTHSPKHKTLSPNHQFYLRIRYVEYYFVHAHMSWSQKLRLTPVRFQHCYFFLHFSSLLWGRIIAGNTEETLVKSTRKLAFPVSVAWCRCELHNAKVRSVMSNIKTPSVQVYGRKVCTFFCNSQILWKGMSFL